VMNRQERVRLRSGTVLAERQVLHVQDTPTTAGLEGSGSSVTFADLERS